MKYLIILLSIFTLSYCKIEEEESIILDVSSINEEFNVGSQNAMFGIKINSKEYYDIFDDSDIEEKTHFNLKIKGEKNNNYEVNCRLWKDGKYIIIFFNVAGEFKETEKFNITNTTKTITYNSYNVQINFNIESLKLTKKEGKLPFIYSKSQQVNVTEKDTKIEMIFKLGAYNNEQLFLDIDKHSTVAFEKCITELNNLKCEILKKNFDPFAINSNHVSVHYIHNSLNYLAFKHIGSLTIKYPKINKEDIFFKIVNIANKEVGLATFVTFETNITDIDKIYTSMEEFTINEEPIFCFFIKHDKIGPLYLSCAIQSDHGDYVIEKIEGFTKNDSHYKYNFVFETQTMHETINIADSITVYINNIFPETINFNSEDVSQLLIFIPGLGNLNNIRLNKDEGDLKCNAIKYEGGSIKNCTITKEHFKGKDGGYYYIHYKNTANDYVTLYEYFGVNVILPSSGNSGKVFKYTFGLLALLFLLI